MPTPRFELTKSPSRRQIITSGAAIVGALGMPALVHAQAGPKIRVGYWPIAAGLPFYAAVEQGFFKDAGVNVEVLRLAGAQQIMEGMLADRIDGCANGTGSGMSTNISFAVTGTTGLVDYQNAAVGSYADTVILTVAP